MLAPTFSERASISPSVFVWLTPSIFHISHLNHHFKHAAKSLARNCLVTRTPPALRIWIQHQLLHTITRSINVLGLQITSKVSARRVGWPSIRLILLCSGVLLALPGFVTYSWIPGLRFYLEHSSTTNWTPLPTANSRTIQKPTRKTVVPPLSSQTGIYLTTPYDLAYCLFWYMQPRRLDSIGVSLQWTERVGFLILVFDGNLWSLFPSLTYHHIRLATVIAFWCSFASVFWELLVLNTSIQKTDFPLFCTYNKVLHMDVIFPDR